MTSSGSEGTQLRHTYADGELYINHGDLVRWVASTGVPAGSDSARLLSMLVDSLRSWGDSVQPPQDGQPWRPRLV